MKSYQKIKFLLSASILCLLFVNTSAFAGTCDGLTGVAKGLCTAATLGVKCDNPEPSASQKSCERLEQEFIAATGQEAPWLVTCPCLSEPIDQYMADYKTNLMCSMNRKVLDIYTGERGEINGIGVLGYTVDLLNRRAIESDSDSTGVLKCATNDERIYNISEVEYNACISTIENFVATYIGTPVETISDDPNGVCGDL